MNETAAKPIRGVIIAAIVVLLAATSGVALLNSVRQKSFEAENPPSRAVPVNAFPGVKHYPSLSPDGKHVAFTWTGPLRNNQDVYIQRVGSPSPVRLTTDPATDSSPIWSPDGRWIAFLRRQWGANRSELRLVQPFGGPELKLTDIRVNDTYFMPPPYHAWCPDSNCLVVTHSDGNDRGAALFEVSLQNTGKKKLTNPGVSALGDTHPAFSSDGRWLIFRRQVNYYTGELYRLALAEVRPSAGSSPPNGSSLRTPQRLTPAAMDAGYPAWIPGAEEILFSARGHLWRLVVPGKNKPARLPFAGDDAMMPSIARADGMSLRMVYVRSFQDANIYRLDVHAPGSPAIRAPIASISSTRLDSTPQLSPDERRVAFASTRSGAWEIWVADLDGTNAAQVTDLGADSGAPCWSPDGERIVFQSNFEGQPDVYMVGVAGGKPQNLTAHPASEWRPSFSSDGRWIYFTSDRSGPRQIWKMPAAGGTASRVTNAVGFAAFESPDGAYLYYNETMETPSPLWRQPVGGGTPVKIVDGVIRAAFAVLDAGIYYIDQPSGSGGLLFTDQPSGETRLRYFNFATQGTTTVSGQLGNVFLGLTASRDGRSVLYSRVDSSLDDLMLVDGFR